MRRICLVNIFFFLVLSALAAPEPFAVEKSYESNKAGGTLTVYFDMPSEHFLYAKSIKLNVLSGGELVEFSVPDPVTVYDSFSESEKQVYKGKFSAVYYLSASGEEDIDVLLEYQGCNESVCFFPQEQKWSLGREKESIASAKESLAATSLQNEDSWQDVVKEFRVMARGSGFMGTSRFLRFLKDAEASEGSTDPSTSRFEGLSVWSALLLILLGGIALNLTPCVLPMIPINLAIIGAGAQAGSRLRGFLLGGAYGLGIALTYGILGLVVVLTGGTFGALNSSPWFNGVMAVVFVVLALAMFDMIHIDFSRFQGRLGGAGKARKTGYLAAFSVGTLSALLAGACVAPVLIGVLVWAQNLYSKGIVLGLLLPFVLGLGMGLPWPLAGAGLSCLPKPGNWMNKVKIGFGVLILLLALYYAHLAYGSLRLSPLNSESEGVSASNQENTRLVAVLGESKASGQPVLIDFWATWCKNCHAMEETTFKSAAVIEALNKYHVFKYQAEQPGDPATKAVLDHFGAIGLPTYIILSPTK